jgi:16S rRNA C967 or C1407 C5-methylase (RsmB/RsmF family)
VPLLLLNQKEIEECVDDAEKPSSGPDILQAAQPIGGIRAVPWLDARLKFYAVPASFNLSKSPCFQQGRIYGQDASSGAAVAALLTAHFDDGVQSSTTSSSEEAACPGQQAFHRTQQLRVLDLCCCPGLKLCAMADFLRHQQPQQQSCEVQLVGVDVSSSRMATCRKVVQKYQIDIDEHAGGNASPMVHIQLYCHDGTQLGNGANGPPPQLAFDSRVAREQRKHLGKRKRHNKSSRARENRLLREALRREPNSTFAAESFDYVLVDAECSTDGSVRHVQQRLDKTNAVLDNPLVTDPQQLADLVGLQRKLACAGFRLLKPSGCMVYSTCSLSRDQNEGVVEWLLNEHPEAKLVPVSVRCASSTSEPMDDRQRKCFASSRLPGTIQFGPTAEQREGMEPDFHNLYGDGFFLAKILKLSTLSR